MRSYDFHGVPAEEALAKIEQVIGEVRMKGETEVVEFITGHGVIKYEARDLLEQRYGLHITTDVSSPTIRVIVE